MGETHRAPSNRPPVCDSNACRGGIGAHGPDAKYDCSQSATRFAPGRRWTRYLARLDLARAGTSEVPQQRSRQKDRPTSSEGGNLSSSEPGGGRTFGTQAAGRRPRLWRQAEAIGSLRVPALPEGDPRRVAAVGMRGAHGRDFDESARASCPPLGLRQGQQRLPSGGSLTSEFVRPLHARAPHGIGQPRPRPEGCRGASTLRSGFSQRLDVQVIEYRAGPEEDFWRGDESVGPLQPRFLGQRGRRGSHHSRRGDS